MKAGPNRKLAILCVLLADLSACNRKVDPADFLPSSPAFQEALRIVLAALSVPADGASTVRVEAQISPDADAARRTVRFHTTLGTWVEPGTDDDKGARYDAPADAAGKAAAFLKSATEVGVAVITVSVISKAADGTVTNTWATVTGEVSFTQVQDALVLTVTPGTQVADGVTPVQLEAKISDGSPPAWNKVDFSTTLGAIDNGGASKAGVDTDDQRIARAQLTSLVVGTATVTARISGFDFSVTEVVDFSQRNDEAIQIEAPSSLPADGASQVSVSALLAAGLEGKKVTFSTSGGSFVETDDGEATASADAGGRATVRLKADTTIREVLLKATIELGKDADGNAVNQTAQKTIDFTRAYPDFIQVSADPPGPLTQMGDPMMDVTTITAELTRDIGDVSPNTVVKYSVSLSDGSPITDMEFKDITRSEDDDGVQTSTAVLTFDMADVTGGKNVVVKASVPGSGTTPGSVSILISD